MWLLQRAHLLLLALWPFCVYFGFGHGWIEKGTSGGQIIALTILVMGVVIEVEWFINERRK